VEAGIGDNRLRSIERQAEVLVSKEKLDTLNNSSMTSLLVAGDWNLLTRKTHTVFYLC